MNSGTIVFTSLVCGITGFSTFHIRKGYVKAVDGCGREIGRVERSKLPKNFGPMMKSGAFGMIDAFKGVQS